jgi:hypothetical protein
MRKLGKTKCDFCGIEFEKPQSELNRNKKLGRKNFCSRSCVGKNHNKNHTFKRNDDIKKYSGNRRDNFTKFRYHFRNINKRKKTVTVTLEDLMEQWEKQNGKCYFTDVNLILSTNTKIVKNPIYSASLDRIDSSKGYEKNNIRWISRAMNHMKNDMSDENVFLLLEIIQNKKTT